MLHMMSSLQSNNHNIPEKLRGNPVPRQGLAGKPVAHNQLGVFFILQPAARLH